MNIPPPHLIKHNNVNYIRLTDCIADFITLSQMDNNYKISQVIEYLNFYNNTDTERPKIFNEDGELIN